MAGDKKTGVRTRAEVLGTQEEKLDRALVTGLMLEVILETSSLTDGPPNPSPPGQDPSQGQPGSQSGRAGHPGPVPPPAQSGGYLVPAVLPPDHRRLASSPRPRRGSGRPRAGCGRLPARRVLRLDRLRAWLQAEGRDLLPHRPHRKLNQDKLWEFLGRTQGGWFRLIDFTRHFGVDRKTAWEYLQKFLHAGLLRHNRGRSAAVRYALETRFLVVRAEALEPEVEAALSGLPPGLVGQVSGWLIATGGEAFWEKEWHGRLEPPRRRQLITRLLAAGLLQEVCQVGESRKLQIAPGWLKDEEDMRKSPLL